MWNLLRTVLLIFALAGFFGQSTAHAMPIQLFHNAGVGRRRGLRRDHGHGRRHDRKSRRLLQDMTPDCMAKMGCAAVASPIPPLVLVAQPITLGAIAFLHLNVSRHGSGPDPLYSPQNSWPEPLLDLTWTP
ncbi:hypothetical protein, partial [Brevundimonas diminuta]|uniref:hypothetical protein n=1 Tax=Brevundimonas diminuta TaxID=293 RepID=UPI002092C9FC